MESLNFHAPSDDINETVISGRGKVCCGRFDEMTRAVQLMPVPEHCSGRFPYTGRNQVSFVKTVNSGSPKSPSKDKIII